MKVIKYLNILIVFFSFAFFLSNCTSTSTQSQKSCSTHDWYEKGRQDGSLGLSKENFQKYQESCPEANHSLYTTGWNAGVSMYCSTESGLLLGRSGKNYSDVCPSQLKEVFISQFKLGQKIYELKKDTEILNQELNNLIQQKQPNPEYNQKIIESKVNSLKKRVSSNKKQIEKLEKAIN